MVPAVRNVAIDCAEAYALACFRSEVTGRPLDPDRAPGGRETAALLAQGPMRYFNQVPEPRAGKNRVRLCPRPATTRDAEADRPLGIGAAFPADHRGPDGSG